MRFRNLGIRLGAVEIAPPCSLMILLSSNRKRDLISMSLHDFDKDKKKQFSVIRYLPCVMMKVH